ncbi:uncharacterized protein LOC110046281 [Orbicella faveolata]|uniref:uncharacterized protein LOC110046281 n=1 Tax=Orbicella faveolata TaxID=48498 RepID=UPI0009E2337E|nr:uncharacterized protein LOC110046281 [Orbicella faveolata]
MNNDRGGDAIIAVQEERARIGGVEVTRQTLIAATDEGVVAVQVNSVEHSGYGGYRPALQGGRPALPGSPRYPTQATNYRESRSCTDYCCLACDSDYEWYKLEGKGCCWVLVLLLLYLVIGVILLPFLILYLVCLCLCYPLGCCRNSDNDNAPLVNS